MLCLDAFKGMGNSIRRLIQLLVCDYQRRLDADDIAVDPAHADEHSACEAVIANRFSLGGCGRLAFVGHEFDADH
jgi:hypothetical protein